MLEEDEKPLTHKQPQPFPRSLEGMSVSHMREYRLALAAEITKIDHELKTRDKVRAAAESLFKS